MKRLFLLFLLLLAVCSLSQAQPPIGGSLAASETVVTVRRKRVSISASASRTTSTAGYAQVRSESGEWIFVGEVDGLTVSADAATIAAEGDYICKMKGQPAFSYRARLSLRLKIESAKAHLAGFGIVSVTGVPLKFSGADEAETLLPTSKPGHILKPEEN